MTTATSAANPALAAQIANAAAAAGLIVASSAPSTSSAGIPTTRFALALAASPNASSQQAGTQNTAQLQLSDSFDTARPEFAAELNTFLADLARRLRNPQPNTLLTLAGIPLAYDNFEWPFHESTAGADTSLVHGLVTLADGTESPFHAKLAAAMTITFREVVRAPEQPFAESFILNAVRKTFDQGQLELVKSGNRQPVPVTTRFYSARSGKFVFNDTTEPQRRDFLAAKSFWLSGVLGAAQGSQPTGQPAPPWMPIWLLDPRDAQYLNCTVADLKMSLDGLVKSGLVALAPDPAFAAPTETLMHDEPYYRQHLVEALAFIKPTFNEDMRAGNTNM